MGIGTLVLVVAIALLALAPTRRLLLAGWSPSVLAAYYLGLVGLALVVAEVRGPARLLVPLLVIAYAAPFVTLRDGLARLRSRGAGPVVRPGPIRRVGPGVEPRSPDGGEGPRTGE